MTNCPAFRETGDVDLGTALCYEVLSSQLQSLAGGAKQSGEQTQGSFVERAVPSLGDQNHGVEQKDLLLTKGEVAREVPISRSDNAA